MTFQAKTPQAPLTALFVGDESLLIQCAEMWLKAGHQIGRIVTTQSTIADWAKAQVIPATVYKRDLSEVSLCEPYDGLLSIANLKIIPDEMLAAAKNAVNFHDGPLPEYAGLNVPVWARIAGETSHGISWHLIEEGVDTGDILVQESFDIADDDTALTLNAKCFSAAIDSFPRVIAALETGCRDRVEQDLSARQYFGKTKKPDAQGRLDFNRPAKELVALVRALDHGAYWNPVTTAKISVAGQLYVVGAARIVEDSGTPGQVLRNEADGLTVACGDQAIFLSELQGLDGAQAPNIGSIKAGDILPSPTQVDRLNKALQQVAKKEEYWRGALRDLAPTRLPLAVDKSDVADWASLDVLTEETVSEDIIFAALSAFLQQAGSEAGTSCALQYGSMTKLPGYLAFWVPIARQEIGNTSVREFIQSASESLDRTKQIDCFAKDLVARDPNLSSIQTPDVALLIDTETGPLQGAALNVVLLNGAVKLVFDQDRLDPRHVERLRERLALILARITNPDAPASALLALPDTERAELLEGWNQTKADIPQDATVLSQIEAQAELTPDATAVVFEHHSLSYAELMTRAENVAAKLAQDGVTSGNVVGIHCCRSLDLVVACLAVWKAGGTYLPLDPAFPADRIAIYLEDSNARFVVTQSDIADELPTMDAKLVKIDGLQTAALTATSTADQKPKPEDLAYLIFTSGSTGRPKGVMVTQANVVNFFAGMDAVIPKAENPVWMAVTSLSFDISVLELFYTLSRGYKLVISGDETAANLSQGPIQRNAEGMDFSLYYWGNDDGAGRGKYELLLEGAKFADQNGFCAVWTPERHFHAFGGPYPNPSVTGAAVAAVTQNIGVRAGSCVAPLHHTARIAEEWAVIDNLTDGKAGLAIASGWQPDDFILRPENTPPANKTAMIEQIADLRKLWKGEPVAFPRKDGEMHEVVTQPRPISKEPEIWVTTAGNPETWKEAGRNGCHVLTHLLGQSVQEVGDKIKLYRTALQEAGHDPSAFKVTLMLHSYLAEDRETARTIAREPMKGYLRSAAGLIKQYAWAFPAFKKPEGVGNAFELDLGGLSEEEMDGILEFAFQRYFEDSGLFGTVQDAQARVAELQGIGVDEIACLIDYGIPTETVLAGLRPLADVVADTNGQEVVAQSDLSLAGQIVRHNVTHMQCTPSMARMIAMNQEASESLSDIKHLLIGGEPLSGTLVRDLSKLTKAQITNMYGPTETTIWSSTGLANAIDATANIGRPIANTQLYVLDADLKPVALGAAGELYIGGGGVTRGYWGREDLTAERFIENPFTGNGLLYRTGDLVRGRLDGALDFIGRADHQVKVRGYRIELGEIESRLEQLAAVTQAVVVAREDSPGDIRLVAYVMGAAAEEEMRAALADALPDYMVPRHFVTLSDFPLTPNKKVDRNALPKPEPKSVPVKAEVIAGAAPSLADADLTGVVTSTWKQVLGLAEIGAGDNFFDLGGHSLLAVQAHRQLKEALGAQRLSITDIFRFPVLRDLVARVETLSGGDLQVTIAEKQKITTGQQSAGATTPHLKQESAVKTNNPNALARHNAMSKRRVLREKRKERQT